MLNIFWNTDIGNGIYYGEYFTFLMSVDYHSKN